MILCIHKVERTSSFLSRWSFYAFCPWWMPCCPETTFSSPGFIPSALGKPCWTTIVHCELTLETASTEDVHLTKDKVLWFLEKPHPMMDRCWGIKTRLLCQFRKPLKGHLLFNPSQWSVVVFFVTITTYPVVWGTEQSSIILNVQVCFPGNLICDSGLPLPYFIIWYSLDYCWISSLFIKLIYVESILSSCLELRRSLEKRKIHRIGRVK